MTDLNLLQWLIVASLLVPGFVLALGLVDVLALHGKWAWIKYVDTDDVGTSPAEMLINIDEEPQP